MHVSESLKSWEKQMEREILGFFVHMGAREAPESWRAELGESSEIPQQGSTDEAPKREVRAC